MRNLIIKLFALSYRFKYGSMLRASTIIYPLFLISGILTALNTYWPEQTWYTLVSYTVTLLSLFFGFIYFKIWPLKRNELNGDQLKQFDLLT